MKKFLLIAGLLLGMQSFAQSIIGDWVSVDDKSGKERSLVRIFESNGKIYGKIVETYDEDVDETAVCEECPGKKKNTPIIGLQIIEDLVKDDDEYTDGTILDPEDGKEYSCTIKLLDNGKLEVRGYLGLSWIGRSQYWKRKG